MNKRHLWKRLLTSVLACGMLLGCFTGCDAKNGEIETIKYSSSGKNSAGEQASSGNDATLPPVCVFPPPTIGCTWPTPTPITLTVWSPSEYIGQGFWLTTLLEEFERLHKDEYEITWEVEVCSENDALSMVTSNTDQAPDVFFYSSNQLSHLLNADALAQLDGIYREQVLNDNPAIMSQSVTYTDDGIYGFPVSVNTWFMYYDKSVFSESDVRSLETMLSKGDVALDISNGWYVGSFFFGAGGTLFGPNGLDAAAGADFKGATGAAVAKRMVELYETGNLLDGSYNADLVLMLERKIGAFFSGAWDYDTLKETLGDDLGVAELPTFNVEGQTYQMKSFAGSKAIGVSSHIEDITTQVAAFQLASFLASKDSQNLCFELHLSPPTHKELANSAAILATPIVSVQIATMNNSSILQPVIPAMNKYWSPMIDFCTGIFTGYITVNNAEEQLAQTLDQING